MHFIFSDIECANLSAFITYARMDLLYGYHNQKGTCTYL